ncbi:MULTISPECIES: hypothetical protein [Polymorphospora]|uniref:EF-hand domain-containing protein n=1 Tax=Polymorphospora lycopeni TaxID=3140240 RepID=A0ABV5CY83_9ACTN
MSEVFMEDVNGDGVEDIVAYEQLPDGGIIAGADTDGDGLIDVMTYDQDGDGVAEQVWEEGVGTYDVAPTEPTTEAAPDYTADYSSDSAPVESGGYYDAAAVSDMLATQHEASMSIINNI